MVFMSGKYVQRFVSQLRVIIYRLNNIPTSLHMLQDERFVIRVGIRIDENITYVCVCVSVCVQENENRMQIVPTFKTKKFNDHL